MLLNACPVARRALNTRCYAARFARMRGQVTAVQASAKLTVVGTSRATGVATVQARVALVFVPRAVVRGVVHSRGRVVATHAFSEIVGRSVVRVSSRVDAQLLHKASLAKGVVRVSAVARVRGIVPLPVVGRGQAGLLARANVSVLPSIRARGQVSRVSVALAAVDYAQVGGRIRMRGHVMRVHKGRAQLRFWRKSTCFVEVMHDGQRAGRITPVCGC